MTVVRRSRRFSAESLERVTRRLMSAAPLCALATVAQRGRAHINHMYFAFTDQFEVVWISDPDSIHSRNLERNSSAAVTIYASTQVWGKPDRGIQLFGTAGITRSRTAIAAYSRRFRDFDAASNDLPYYLFKPRAVKLFDERGLAAGTLVTARVTAGGLRWEKTEAWA